MPVRIQKGPTACNVCTQMSTNIKSLHMSRHIVVNYFFSSKYDSLNVSAPKH